MNAGVRNKVTGQIEDIKVDGVMSMVKMRGTWVDGTMKFTSVMTTDSLEESGFKKGDAVDALVKAINVVFVKH